MRQTMILLLVLVTLWAASASAQFTNGEPLFGNGTTTPAAIGKTLDASLFPATGGDACTQLTACLICCGGN